MFLRQRPGSNDATTPSGIGSGLLPPLLLAPTPRRATSSSILDSEEGSSDCERYDSRNPLPNTPLQYSTPSVLNQQLPLNGVPDSHHRPRSCGGSFYTPRHGHSRVSSWGSARSSVSPSSKKAARFSPNLTSDPPEHMHNPPPPGATPIRSAMRHTPLPGRSSPLYRFPAPSPDDHFTPSITIVQPSPPSPTSAALGAHRTPAQTNAGDDSDEDATPGQRLFRSRSSLPGNLRGRSSPDRRGTTSPVERGRNDSGYLSSRSPVFPDGPVRPPAPQSQEQPQRTGKTSTNQSYSVASFKLDNQHRSSRCGFHTSRQAPSCSSVTPGASWPSTNAFPNSLDPSGLRYATPTPARPVGRSTTHSDLPRINTSSGYPAGAQLNAGPRSSHIQHPPHATPHGPARAAFTPANGNERANVDVNSVINNLLGVPPTSVAWQTPGGLLTWTPHPALPGSGQNLLGGGIGFGGRVGNADWITGGYPLPGACPSWTPGAWPPPARSTPATSRRVPIQLAPWMIPNPCNATLPHIMWDVSQLPTTANRITGNHIIVSLMDKLDDVATHPAVDRLVVVCQVGVAERFWGHIEVKASRPKGVTVWDVFNGIHGYFQKRVGRRELGRMKELLGDERLEEKMADAFYQRICITPALPGYELKEGLKRVDCLGDRCFFWGLYVSYNDDGSWQLNLGLVNRGRCA